MTLQRFEHQGAAPAVGLAASIGAADLTFTLTSGTGYPTGASSRLFILVLDPGTPQEEKVLCSSRSGTTITVNSSGLGGRGYDGTVASSHSVGTNNVQHVLGAIEIDDDNDHIYTTTRDDHTQYARTDGTRAFTGPISVTGNITSTAFLNGSSASVTGGTTTGTLSVTNGATVGSLSSTGVVSGSALLAGLTGTNGRYVGQTNGSPATGTYVAGDFADDPTNLVFWLCTVGGTPGTWIQTGGKTDAAWTAVSSFANSWGNFGAPEFNAGFRLVNGRVYLRGCISLGTIGQTAFTLPAGYRPAATISFASASNGAFGQCSVKATGDVQPFVGSSVSFFLDTVSFDLLS